MAGGGGGGSAANGPAVGFAARLTTSPGGVSNTLTLAQYQGNAVLVNKKTVTIPTLGLTRLVSDNLITAAGADSGAPGVASTLYYVYISNGLVSFSPSSIRLCSTAPTTVNGVKYLGSSGAALNWRFVGWVKLNATPKFESTELNRWIINYYNRLALPVMVAPNYADSNAFQLTAFPAAWGKLVPSAGVSWIDNGEDSVDFFFKSLVDVIANNGTYIGISIDAASPENADFSNSSTGENVSYSVYQRTVPSEGPRTADMWGFSPGGNSAWYHDVPRNGLTAGPRMTFLTALIPG